MTVENIDRSIFEALRLQAVALGVLPDQAIYPDTEPGLAAWTAANEALGTNLVSVYGVGSSIQKGEMLTTMIIVENKTITPGSVGAWGTQYIGDTVGDSLELRENPSQTNNIQYQIRYIATNGAQGRVCAQIIMNALGNKKFLYGLNQDLTYTEDEFLIERQSEENLDGIGFVERVARYIVKDCVIENEIDLGLVPKIGNIQVTITDDPQTFSETIDLLPN